MFTVKIKSQFLCLLAKPNYNTLSETSESKIAHDHIIKSNYCFPKSSGKCFLFRRISRSKYASTLQCIHYFTSLLMYKTVNKSNPHYLHHKFGYAKDKHISSFCFNSKPIQQFFTVQHNFPTLLLDKRAKPIN